MRVHPGVSLITAIGLAALGEACVPASLALGLLPRVVPSAIAFAAGSLLLYWAIDTLRREKTDIEPFREPSAIAITGPYRFSRNPMYVANLLLMLGFVFLSLSAWFVLATVVQFVLLNAWVIPSEERSLNRAFPEAAQNWFSKTRRWL